MDDKHTLRMPKGMGKIDLIHEVNEDVPRETSTGIAPNERKSEGITYIGKYKKYHAEFKASGQTYNCGLFDTEAQAATAIAMAKAHLYA